MPKLKQTNKTIDDKVFNQISDIIKFTGESNLAELELETSDLKISLKKNSKTVVVEQVIQPEQIVQTAAVNNVVTPVNTPKVEETLKNINLAKSPMTGTFYEAPSPSSPPFAKEGDSIVIGQTICIVEAMKMMNEIKADCNGTVVKVLLENGDSVEKGTVLFHIENKA